jgi:cytoskeletal protein CcmA (bactofilin family)
MKRLTQHARRFWIGIVAMVLALGLAGTALAQTDDEIYRLEAGEVLEDDLYIAAGEIYIDGTIRGDLIAAAGIIEINGTIEGDAMLAGADVTIDGTVTDDVRVGAAGFTLNGTVGDDLIAAAGGGPGQTSFQMDGRTVDQGIRLNRESVVGGDARIGGGDVQMNGSIEGNLLSGAYSINLDGSVGGDAEIGGESIRIGNDAQIGGDLNYTAPERLAGLDGVGGEVTYNEPVRAEAEPVPQRAVGVVTRTVVLLLGFALLGFLLLRFRPQTLEQPATALAAQPVQALLFGLVTALLLIFLPLGSALLVALMWAFWGWTVGIVVLGFLFTGLTLFWLLSPLVSGLWLGRLIAQQLNRDLGSLGTLMAGVALIMVAAAVPFLGWLVYLFSFVLALGALIVAARGGYDTPATA